MCHERKIGTTMTEQKGLTNSTYHEVIGNVSQPDALPEVRSIQEVLNTLRLHGTGIRVKQAEDKPEKPEA